MNSYNYIIIGGGAAGCVLANRLSSDSDRSVLLLEAGGPDQNEDIHNLGGFVKLWGSDRYDWKFTTTRQGGLKSRQIVLNQGKVIGGGSSINAMMHVRGNRRNYDHWNYLGNEGWGFSDLLPYFKKVENHENGESEYHGAGGPMSIRVCPDPDMVSEPFLNGAMELGFDGPRWDYNGARQEDGAGLLEFNVTPNGERASAATAYLDPVKARSNLTIVTGAEASRVLFQKHRAVGVEYSADGQTKSASTDGEVIICAGSYVTPKILMLSGLGPADHLGEHGIDVLADLPGVGQNLRDHLQLSVVYRTEVDNPHPILLSGNVLFVRSRDGLEAAPPDLQLNFAPAAPAPLIPLLPPFGFPVCIFLPILVQPQSIGEVRLRSSNPADAPLIDPNYLQQETDVQVFRRSVELAREIADSTAFRQQNGGEIAPGEADLDDYIRQNATTLWHPVGTAKMGRDALAVVDPQLRVYGVEGLRVSDASVMPTTTSGNTHFPVLMIAEKLAAGMLS